MIMNALTEQMARHGFTTGEDPDMILRFCVVGKEPIHTDNTLPGMAVEYRWTALGFSLFVRTGYGGRDLRYAANLAAHYMLLAAKVK